MYDTKRVRMNRYYLFACAQDLHRILELLNTDDDNTFTCVISSGVNEILPDHIYITTDVYTDAGIHNIIRSALKGIKYTVLKGLHTNHPLV